MGANGPGLGQSLNMRPLGGCGDGKEHRELQAQTLQPAVTQLCDTRAAWGSTPTGGALPSSRPPSSCLSLQPPQYKLDPRLARLLGVHTQTRASIMQALWLYIKHNKLQDSHEKEYINCNRYFRQVSPRPTAPARFAGRRAPLPPPVRPEKAPFLAQNRHSRLPSLHLCPIPRL